MIRLKYDNINGSKRIITTEDIVDDKGLETEHWHICGDGESERRGESFLLYRYFQSLCGDTAKPNPKAKNILWAAPEDCIYAFEAGGSQLFGNKTQGEPYHMAVLAAGILFENRFPDSIFFSVYINRRQAEVLLPWMNKVLKEPVKIPIVTDGERLYKKLQELYDNPDLAIQRFRSLAVAVNEDDILLKHAPRAYVLQLFVELLSQDTSITDWRAIRIISSFLAATQDVKQLIELVLQVGKDRKGFELEELLRILVTQFITITKEAREPIRLFVYPQNPLEHMAAIFAQNLSRLGDPPKRIDFYIDSAELLKTFTSYMPAKEDLFQAILQEEEKKCYQTIERIQKIIMESEEERVSKQPGEQIPPYTSLEAYIRAEIRIQVEAETQKATEDAKTKKLAKTDLADIINDIQEAVAKLPKTARYNSAQFYKEAIYKRSCDRGIVLSRAQWAHIDNCQDITILRALMVLTNNTSSLLVFVTLREYILKNPQTWPQLVETVDNLG